MSKDFEKLRNNDLVISNNIDYSIYSILNVIDNLKTISEEDRKELYRLLHKFTGYFEYIRLVLENEFTI